jgi:hypothetical protein
MRAKARFQPVWLSLPVLLCVSFIPAPPAVAAKTETPAAGSVKAASPLVVAQESGAEPEENHDSFWALLTAGVLLVLGAVAVLGPRISSLLTRKHPGSNQTGQQT